MSTPNPASSPAGPSRTLPSAPSLPSIASPFSAATPAAVRPPASAPVARPYRPGTFRSLAPLMDGMLEDVRAVAEGREQGADHVVGKAKEILAALRDMRATALALPGGDMSTAELEAVERDLARRAEDRRETLRKLAATATPAADAVPPAADDGMAVA